jgi:hypothetical protein
MPELSPVEISFDNHSSMSNILNESVESVFVPVIIKVNERHKKIKQGRKIKDIISKSPLTSTDFLTTDVTNFDKLKLKQNETSNNLLILKKNEDITEKSTTNLTNFHGKNNSIPNKEYNFNNVLEFYFKKGEEKADKDIKKIEKRECMDYTIENYTTFSLSDNKNQVKIEILKNAKFTNKNAKKQSIQCGCFIF